MEAGLEIEEGGGNLSNFYLYLRPPNLPLNQ
jgi:hypothetical protein